MKDAKGHGSDSRSGTITPMRTAGLRGVGIATAARFSNTPMRPDRDFRTDADRTVYNLRQRMKNVGAGERHGIMQAVKNFLGG